MISTPTLTQVFNWFKDKVNMRTLKHETLAQLVSSYPTPFYNELWKAEFRVKAQSESYNSFQQASALSPSKEVGETLTKQASAAPF